MSYEIIVTKEVISVRHSCAG